MRCAVSILESEYLLPVSLVAAYFISTLVIAIDASRRGKRVGSWIVASIILWPLILPIYVYALRGDRPASAH